MKVKYIATALVNDSFLRITKGKEYQVLARQLSSICINDDYGESFWMDMDKFSLGESPQIEVGSEWVATLAKQGEKTLVVLHVGQQMSLCKWVADNREFSIKNTDFNTAYKPKPKTVTMYFYKTPHGYVGYSDKHPFDAPLFTKEIEL